MKKMSKWFLKRLPVALSLVVVWTIVRLFINIEGFWSVNKFVVIVICICFAVVVVEFMKSADISMRSFQIDLLFAVVAVVLGTFALTKVGIEKTGFHFTDVLMAGLILIDATVSPINSFRTALRNFEVQPGSGQSLM